MTDFERPTNLEELAKDTITKQIAMAYAQLKLKERKRETEARMADFRGRILNPNSSDYHSYEMIWQVLEGEIVNGFDTYTYTVSMLGDVWFDNTMMAVALRDTMKKHPQDLAALDEAIKKTRNDFEKSFTKEDMKNLDWIRKYLEKSAQTGGKGS